MLWYSRASIHVLPPRPCDYRTRGEASGLIFNLRVAPWPWTIYTDILQVASLEGTIDLCRLQVNNPSLGVFLDQSGGGLRVDAERLDDTIGNSVTSQCFKKRSKLTLHRVSTK